MPLDVGGKTFYTVNDVADVVDVARQTLWRWRKAKKIPGGRRYRGRELLYTQEEVQQVYFYAHRMEAEDATAAFKNQLKLFS